MVSKLIKFVVVIALVALVISIFPIFYTWIKELIYWFLELGKWGVIVLFSACIMIIIDFFR